MSNRLPALRAGLAALLLLGCGRPAPPPAAPPGDTGAPAPASTTPPGALTAGPAGVAVPPGPPAGAATAPAGPAATPAATPAPVVAPPVEVLEAQALIPGAATALKTGEQITVDPGATFRVLLKGTWPEARLSLLDGADAMLASAGGREAGTITTVTLQPAAPLKAGGAYRLRLDGATTRELRAADGTVRAPVEFPVLAAGEPPSEPRARPKKPKKRP